VAYYTEIFSPETYEGFSQSDKTVAGFRPRQRPAVERLQRGDKLVAYVTGLSRWVGLLEVVDADPFESSDPIVVPVDDPFVVRVRTKPIVWLGLDHAVPIRTDVLWDHLSFTRGHTASSALWTAPVRNSLKPLSDADGQLLERVLRSQIERPAMYPLTDLERRKIEKLAVRREGGVVEVTVPDSEEESEAHTPAARTTVRESIQIQALLARIGSTMGFRVWVPASDRAGVLAEWGPSSTALLDKLPLNYDETTLRTIENIDMLWVKGRSIVRAFEVEHTTAIYSGILRMADLLALQPNMDIKLHIVAPEERQEKVLSEIRRPVFSLLEGAPLSKRCTFLTYDSLRELADQPHLAHLSDSVLADYEERA
jgi:hypothetical protein